MKALSPEQFILQIASAIIPCQKRERFVVIAKGGCAGRLVDESEASRTAVQDPCILPYDTALHHMLAGGVICDIVMHLFPEKEQETGWEVV